MASALKGIRAEEASHAVQMARIRACNMALFFFIMPVSSFVLFATVSAQANDKSRSCYCPCTAGCDLPGTGHRLGSRLCPVHDWRVPIRSTHSDILWERLLLGAPEGLYRCRENTTSVRLHDRVLAAPWHQQCQSSSLFILPPLAALDLTQ